MPNVGLQSRVAARLLLFVGPLVRFRRYRLFSLPAETAVLHQLQNERGFPRSGRSGDQDTGTGAADHGLQFVQQPLPSREERILLQQRHLEEQRLQGQLRRVVLKETH